MVNEAFETVELWVSAILHAVLAAILLLLGEGRLDQPKYLRKVQGDINSRIDLQKGACELCLITMDPNEIRDSTSKTNKKKKVNINKIDKFDSISKGILGKWVVISDGPFKGISFDLSNISKSKENIIYGEALHHLLVEKPCSIPNNGVFNIEKRGQVLQNKDIIKLYLFKGYINGNSKEGKGKISSVILQVGGSIKFGTQRDVRLERENQKSKTLDKPINRAELASQALGHICDNAVSFDDQYEP